MNIIRVLGINAFLETGAVDRTLDLFHDALGAKIGPDQPWLDK